MTDKYIKVSDLEKCFKKNTIQYKNLSDNAIELPDYKAEIEKIKFKICEFFKDDNGLDTYHFTQKLLSELINPKPEKFGGFTIPQWEQLIKLSYVSVALTTGDNVFIDNASIQCYASTINKLLPDAVNMERTNTDIPDGIKVEYFWEESGDKVIGVTPLYLTGNWKHYRILGAAEDE